MQVVIVVCHYAGVCAQWFMRGCVCSCVIRKIPVCMCVCVCACVCVCTYVLQESIQELLILPCRGGPSVSGRWDDGGLIQ